MPKLHCPKEKGPGAQYVGGRVDLEADLMLLKREKSATRFIDTDSSIILSVT
jgi:hypothetical protein